VARAVAGGLAGAFLGTGTAAALALVLPHAFGPPLVLAGLLLGVGIGGWALPRLLPGSGPGPGTRGERETAFVLDTSALVDGRLPEIAQAGFLPKRLLLPPFVLRELRGLADASDPGKRGRGRRGLDSLERLRAVSGAALVFLEDDLPELKEVDLKLVEVARREGARLLTQDGALRKVAAARGVATASLHDLGKALRLAAQPGEVVRLAIVKEGREPGQGVGHLEDGTMVVVENGRALLGTESDVVLTNVVQTSGGRMFFARVEPGG
jgi:uncharacterized protein YacL